MTAQHHNDDTFDSRPLSTDETDPIGPVQLPKHGKVGARALALVGTASAAAIAVQAVANGTTFTTIANSPY